ncbi:MAG: oxygen-independent coproporphyrinogen III oxidase [Xanthomonadales bacterium]|nr:oxygen-independent coproporphyrinogen III oxidase [Xanthomonadales bacterium]
MSQQVQFNPELVQRYDVAGPRYTSYPTAVQFHEGFDAELYRRFVRESNSELIPSPLSLYVHLPFCHSLCYYCGCNKKVTQHIEQGVAYLQFLSQEIRMRGELFDHDRQVTQLHFGGGTPTYFDDIQLEQLMANLEHAFTFAPARDREFSIEVDPRTVDRERLSRLVDLGFNRISLGVQDIDPDVQKAVNRIQDPQTTLNMISDSRALGFKSVSIDLIYGLPLQTTASFSKTLAVVLGARPDRLAVYNYAHMPEVFRSQRMINAADIPTPQTKLELMALTIEKLTGAGYVYIGMDHFALPEDELSRAQREGHLHRNFQGYSTHSECDLVGLGVSAIDKVGDCFAQNYKKIPQWQDAIGRGELPVWRGPSLSQEGRLRSAVIEAIMCHSAVNFQEFSNRFHFDFNDHFALELHRLQLLADDGLADLNEDGFTLTAEGRLLMRAVAMIFDEYIQSATDQPRYSRVI